MDFRIGRRTSQTVGFVGAGLSLAKAQSWFRSYSPKAKRRIVLKKDEFRLLLAPFEGMYRVMILLAGCVGLRRSEIFGLKWADFNFLKNEIFIQRSTVEGYEDETKTESSDADVPLHSAIVEALLAWKQATPYGAEDDYVFASRQSDHDGKETAEQQHRAAGLSPS